MARGSRSRKDNADTGLRKVREFDQDFEIKLDTVERAAEGIVVCDLVREYDSIELAKKTANTTWTKRMKEIRTLLSRHSANALNGKREDKIKVEEFFDVATQRVIVVRTDTETVIGDRKPSQAELDEWVDFGEPAAEH